MNYWIFQAIPERYDLRRELIEGKKVTWYATRYRSRMSPGDLVFFWLAGSEEVRGVYGWGVLSSAPYIKTEWETYGVDVRYEKRLKSHLPAGQIRTASGLQDLLILRAPAATNFLLIPQEAHAIAQLIDPDQRPEEV